jgi:hypothetical protein
VTRVADHIWGPVQSPSVIGLWARRATRPPVVGGVKEHLTVGRLRQVLGYRPLGFGLREVADLVGDPSTDAVAHVRRLGSLLLEQRDHADAMAAAIDKELEEG